MKAEAEASKTSQLASLGELAGGVAHEISNPVNGIINYAQILSNKIKEGTEEQNIAGLIIKEGDRIAGIVNSLLSFERSRKEKKHPVSIHEIMSDTLKLTESQIRNDGIKSAVDIPPDLPKIFAHPQQIKVVFLNIISNSRYALNHKFPHIHESKIFNIYGKEVTIDNIPHIEIMFYDNGIGIREEILDKVMNPFFTTGEPGVNAGLGLSISHSIINNHSGMLTVDSKEGEFTTVTIGLPVRDI
jgi:signal transduction histidine kinase